MITEDKSFFCYFDDLDLLSSKPKLWSTCLMNGIAGQFSGEKIISPDNFIVLMTTYIREDNLLSDNLTTMRQKRFHIIS